MGSRQSSLGDMNVVGCRLCRRMVSFVFDVCVVVKFLSACEEEKRIYAITKKSEREA